MILVYNGQYADILMHLKSCMCAFNHHFVSSMWSRSGRLSAGTKAALPCFGETHLKTDPMSVECLTQDDIQDEKGQQRGINYEVSGAKRSVSIVTKVSFDGLWWETLLKLHGGAVSWENRQNSMCSWWQRSVDGSSSVLCISVVTIATDFPASSSPEDKVKKTKTKQNPLKHQGGQKVQTPSFLTTYSTHTQQLWKMPAESGEEKTLTAIKTTESILLFTQEVGIQQDNNERKRE